MKIRQNQASSLFAGVAFCSSNAMFSQPWTCCPPSSFELAAIRSINDSPSRTLEHHMHFHLPKSNSNTLKATYLIKMQSEVWYYLTNLYYEKELKGILSLDRIDVGRGLVFPSSPPSFGYQLGGSKFWLIQQSLHTAKSSSTNNPTSVTDSCLRQLLQYLNVTSCILAATLI